jgi:uncharacterized membrane protein
VPSLASWLKLVHVLLAFGFVAGLVGRTVVLRRAARSADMVAVTMLVSLAGTFEQRMMIPGSIALLPAGLFTMWAEHLPLFRHGVYWLPVSLFVYVALIVLVPTIFIPRGKVFGAALEEAQATGSVTPALSAAFRDRRVAFARTTESLGVAFILALMVLKPF